MGLTEAMEEIFGNISGRVQKVCSGEYSAVRLGGGILVILTVWAQ